MSPYENMSDDARDAARYRWLRTKQRVHIQTETEDAILSSCFESAEDFDAALDAAMAADSMNPSERMSNG